MYYANYQFQRQFKNKSSLGVHYKNCKQKISQLEKELVLANQKITTLENKQQFVIYNGNTLNVNQQETPLNSIPKNSKFFFSI